QLRRCSLPLLRHLRLQFLTATDFCSPNNGFTAEGGSHDNPPNKYFVLPIEAFEKIAIWKAGNMPVQYR
ncbi:hypothetical protein UlMin_039880, partial [Ulmus minor]